MIIFKLVVALLLLCSPCWGAYTKWAVVTDAEFGAVGDGSNDDTAEIQAALDTGSPVYIPPGTYKVSSDLLLNYPGQIISGQINANGTSHIYIISNAGFTNGVVKVLARNIQIRDLLFTFAQPNNDDLSDVDGDSNTTESCGDVWDDDNSLFTSCLAYMWAHGLTQYVPAVYSNGYPVDINDCKITNAWDGIYLNGAVGGTSIHNLEISSFDDAVEVASLTNGSVNIDSMHYWPFDLTSSENDDISSFLFDIDDTTEPSGSVAVKVGDCYPGSQVNITNAMFMYSYGIFMQTRAVPGSVNYPRVTFKNSWDERANAILMLDGELLVDSCLLQCTTAGAPLPYTGSGYSLRKLAGKAVIKNSYIRFSWYVGSNGPSGCDDGIIYNKTGDLIIDGCYIYKTGDELYNFNIEGGQCIFSNNVFFMNAHVTPAIGYVASGALITMVGNRFTYGVPVKLAADGDHILYGNWFYADGQDSGGNDLPSSYSGIVYENNIDQ